MKKFLKYKFCRYFSVWILCFVALKSHAQIISPNSIQEQFISYQSNNYNEKIFVHTDKTFYITGESIWFKIYCVDEQLHRPASVSKIAYVEIINKENKAILQAKIKMTNGSGSGSFVIPSFVNSDNYMLRAYTKWMTNFEADYFFQQPLAIFNNLKPHFFSQPIDKKKYTVTFFPEGGNLVEGITSKIAFKAVDEYGDPAECSGIITDSHNNSITDFHPYKFGMGSFNFTPKAGETYNALIKIADTTFDVKLPPVYKKGDVMHLEEGDDSDVKIHVFSSATNDEIIYILVHSQNLIKDFQQTTFSNGKAVFRINKNILPGGISDITIFNSTKQPVCERLYFKPPGNKLNIQIEPDKNNYQTQKDVNISLETKDNLNISAMADMSVSVFMVDSIQPAAYPDILSYLLLTSELKGKIVSPEYYFKSNNKDVKEAADNLMLTQGWRRFKWEDVLQNKMPYFEFIPEAEGMIITGKIAGKYNALSAKNVNATLSVTGENFQLSNALSNESGLLHFNMKNFYGTNNLVILTDSNNTVDLVSPFSNKFSSGFNPDYNLPDKFKQQLLFRSINTQVDNAYLVGKKQYSYLYDAADTSLFYGKPDKRYYLDDYTRFTTMEEVMREYVTEVRVRKISEQFRFKVIDLPAKAFFDNDPLILLDGVKIMSANTAMQIDPLKIKKLDVVGRKYYHSNSVSEGIISFTSFKGDFAGFPLNAGNIVIKYDGLQLEREFYSPAYDAVEAHLPDVRNVLYWSPLIKTDENGKAKMSFYTSGITGKFICVIQGISSSGLAGSNSILFDVTE